MYKFWSFTYSSTAYEETFCAEENPILYLSSNSAREVFMEHQYLGYIVTWKKHILSWYEEDKFLNIERDVSSLFILHAKRWFVNLWVPSEKEIYRDSFIRYNFFFREISIIFGLLSSKHVSLTKFTCGIGQVRILCSHRNKKNSFDA